MGKSERSRSRSRKRRRSRRREDKHEKKKDSAPGAGSAKKDVAAASAVASANKEQVVPPSASSASTSTTVVNVVNASGSATVTTGAGDTTTTTATGTRSGTVAATTGDGVVRPLGANTKVSDVGTAVEADAPLLPGNTKDVPSTATTAAKNKKSRSRSRRRDRRKNGNEATGGALGGEDGAKSATGAEKKKRDRDRERDRDKARDRGDRKRSKERDRARDKKEKSSEAGSKRPAGVQQVAAVPLHHLQAPSVHQPPVATGHGPYAAFGGGAVGYHPGHQAAQVVGYNYPHQQRGAASVAAGATPGSVVAAGASAHHAQQHLLTAHTQQPAAGGAQPPPQQLLQHGQQPAGPAPHPPQAQAVAATAPSGGGGSSSSAGYVANRYMQRPLWSPEELKVRTLWVDNLGASTKANALMTFVNTFVLAVTQQTNFNAEQLGQQCQNFKPVYDVEVDYARGVARAKLYFRSFEATQVAMNLHGFQYEGFAMSVRRPPEFFHSQLYREELKKWNSARRLEVEGPPDVAAGSDESSAGAAAGTTAGTGAAGGANGVVGTTTDVGRGEDGEPPGAGATVDGEAAGARKSAGGSTVGGPGGGTGEDPLPAADGGEKTLVNGTVAATEKAASSQLVAGAVPKAGAGAAAGADVHMSTEGSAGPKTSTSKVEAVPSPTPAVTDATPSAPPNGSSATENLPQRRPSEVAETRDLASTSDDPAAKKTKTPTAAQIDAPAAGAAQPLPKTAAPPGDLQTETAAAAQETQQSAVQTAQHQPPPAPAPARRRYYDERWLPNDFFFVDPARCMVFDICTLLGLPSVEQIAIDLGLNKRPKKLSFLEAPLFMSEDQLKEIFLQFGPLKYFELMLHRDGGSRGFGMLEYDPEAEVDFDLVFECLNGFVVGEKALKVQHLTAQVSTTRNALPPLTGTAFTQGGQQEQQGSASGPLALTNGAAQPGAATNTAMPAGAPVKAATVSSRLFKNPALAQQLQYGLREGRTPSPVVQLLNCVTEADILDDSDFYEVKNLIHKEASKYGVVEEVLIPRPSRSAYHDSNAASEGGVGKIFVHYQSVTSARKFQSEINGRKFDDRVVCAAFYPSTRFAQGLYALGEGAKNY